MSSDYLDPVFKLTVWFPIALRNIIKRSVPKVERYSELGRARNDLEMDQEYRRLLNRDRNPFSFLYNGMLFTIYSSFSI